MLKYSLSFTMVNVGIALRVICHDMVCLLQQPCVLYVFLCPMASIGCMVQKTKIKKSYSSILSLKVK